MTKKKADPLEAFIDALGLRLPAGESGTFTPEQSARTAALFDAVQTADPAWNSQRLAAHIKKTIEKRAKEASWQGSKVFGGPHIPKTAVKDRTEATEREFSRLLWSDGHFRGVPLDPADRVWPLNTDSGHNPEPRETGGTFTIHLADIFARVEAQSPDDLTPAQAEVVKMRDEGMTLGQIAKRRQTTRATVQSMLRAVEKKRSS